ncbi:MAG: hypothetical protein H6909_04885 [Rickettsiaceae bacterium]|nr:hypothetical protein [Rickettsiaceae bacterium]
MADKNTPEVTNVDKINAAKKNVKEALTLAIENPTDSRIKTAANTIVIANELVKGDPQASQALQQIRSDAVKNESREFTQQLEGKIKQQVSNIQKWHSKAEQQTSKISGQPKPKLSIAAKAAAARLGEAARSATARSKEAITTALNKFKGKDSGRGR